jgi:antitoxin component of MazEF toxin-antitoxin module
MKTSVIRWGDTLAIRLPEAELAKIGLREGADIDVLVQANSVVITPVHNTRDEFISQLWACKEAGIDQEPLWSDGLLGGEVS